MSSFTARHRPEWEELESLVRRARRWTGSLSADERARLNQLYRRTTVHLARVATRSTDQVLIDYLNHLTAAAHSIIYLPPRQSIAGRIGQFAVDDFPQTIARHWRPNLLSAVLLICGALIYYLASLADSVFCHAMWPAGAPRQPGASAEQLLS